MRIGDDRIRMASAQKLRREYEVLEFHDGEGIKDFDMRLSGIVNLVMRIGDDRIRMASAQKLWREYEVLEFHDGEGVKDFDMRLSWTTRSSSNFYESPVQDSSIW
jgi:hypothetical protein